MGAGEDGDRRGRTMQSPAQIERAKGRPSAAAGRVSGLCHRAAVASVGCGREACRRFAPRRFVPLQGARRIVLRCVRRAAARQPRRAGCALCKGPLEACEGRHIQRVLRRVARRLEHKDARVVGGLAVAARARVLGAVDVAVVGRRDEDRVREARRREQLVVARRVGPPGEDDRESERLGRGLRRLEMREDLLADESMMPSTKGGFASYAEGRKRREGAARAERAVHIREGGAKAP